MGPDLPLRLRLQFAVTRRLTAVMRRVGIREQVISLRNDLRRAIRLAFERAGSDRYSRPTLHEMDVKLARIIGRDGGVFIEAGGFDGFTQSNTYYLKRFPAGAASPRADAGAIRPRMPQPFIGSRPPVRARCPRVPDRETDLEFGDLSVRAANRSTRWSAVGASSSTFGLLSCFAP